MTKTPGEFECLEGETLNKLHFITRQVMFTTCMLHFLALFFNQLRISNPHIFIIKKNLFSIRHLSKHGTTSRKVLAWDHLTQMLGSN